MTVQISGRHGLRARAELRSSRFRSIVFRSSHQRTAQTHTHTYLPPGDRLSKIRIRREKQQFSGVWGAFFLLPLFRGFGNGRGPSFETRPPTVWLRRENREPFDWFDPFMGLLYTVLLQRTAAKMLPHSDWGLFLHFRFFDIDY